MSGHMRGPGRGVPIGRAKMDKVTMNRLLSYLKEYKLRFTVVLFCILVSAVAGVAGSLFLQVVIDDYITPLLKTASPDFAGLFQAVLTMAAIYLIGILATLFYNRTMVSISQGILKKIRDQMFSHMQRLPIRYFDTHTHGDIMSRYTNDTDTLRQMLSMSVPQMFSSIVTIVAVICAMLYTSVYLTILVAVVVFFIMKVFKFIASHSGKYFIKQQETLGDVNGYIEEMINGQKVVKVFCHEEKAKEVFREKNAALCENATKANQYDNILMP
ncbi:MAG: ABC transporter ATP-binding protein, partial [Anaerotignum sp.]|uniref:ABC transporter permease n=1 Tax=Anaerotignum sp. TaxID=2039241 RepID=UPI002E778E25